MKRWRNFWPGALVSGAVVVAAVAAGLSPSTAATPPAATFNPNLLLKGSDGAAEPSIRTDMFGRSFVTGPVGVPGGCPSFRVLHDGSASTAIGKPDMGVGGGDCDWAIGPQETAVTSTDGDLAFSSLTLPSITVNKSDNGGTTFGVPNALGTQVLGDDRMWMAADPKLNGAGFADVFMTYHDVTVGGIQMSVSIDGGQTYTQNSQLISASLLPQANGLGTNAGNELGNVVARRDSSGKLTLYSIFETPEDATANSTGAPNFNRVYVAIGTVTVDIAPPVVTWTDNEVFHGAPGSRLNRIFPNVAVDNDGRIYATWSDGNNIFVASSLDGTIWTAPVSVGQPTVTVGTTANHVNTEIMPWTQAGAGGIIDVVFYGAYGGTGAQPNPQDDVHNQWNTFFAQSIDAGATWTISKASDHQIHSGPICIDGLNCNPPFSNRDRTLLDFFQVSIDPTNGAADIAYADDHAAPGSSVIYFTRQCTGISATTGQLLTNDCKVPPPPPTPPQGNVCPGPQILDFINDAPNNYPGGMGQNMDNLDIVSGTFKSAPAGTTIDVTLKLKNLQAPPTVQNPNYISAFWTVYFQYGTANSTNKTWWYVQATSNTDKVVTFNYGTWNGSFNTLGTITGEFHTGPMGTIAYHLPRVNIGSPPDGAHLTNTWADTRGSFTVAGTGLFFTAAGDRAPDSNYGADHIVGTPPCPAGTGGGGGGEHDGNGDIHGKNGGNAQFESDEDGATDGDQNSEKLQDPGAGETVTSTQIDGVQFDSSVGTMTVYGEGVNGLGIPVAFLIVEQKGSPGFYSIEVSDGYVNGGSLTSGSITI